MLQCGKLGLERADVNILGRWACGERSLGARLAGLRHGANAIHQGNAFGKVTIAMQDDITARVDRRFAALWYRAGQGLHRNVIGHQKTREADICPYAADHCLRCRGGASLTQRAVDQMGCHTHGDIRKGSKRCKVYSVEALFACVNCRKIKMAVHARKAVSRDVFNHRKDAATQTSVHNSAPNCDNGIEVRAVAAIAQEGVRIRSRNIEHGRAVRIDTEITQFKRYDLVA